MSQERADLNWYHKPPDYFAGRSSSAREGAAAESQQAAGPQQARAGQDHDTAAGDFTFDDFLDIINPLQHLPGISMVYRAMTGDEISPHARIIGGGLYGGGTGFVTAIANAISEEASGRDLGDNLIAAVFGEDETAPSVASSKADDSGAGQSVGRPDLMGAHVSPGPMVGSGPEPKAPAGLVGIAEAASEVTASTGPGQEAVAAQSARTGGDTGPPAATVDQGSPQDRAPGDAPAPLEGKAALAALFLDLRGPGRPAGVPAPTPAAKPQLHGRGLEPEPRAALQAASAPISAPGPGPKAPAVAPRGGLALDPSLFAGGGVSNKVPDGKAETGHPFTGQMLHGLQKYEELMTGRQVSQADIGRRED